MLISEAKTCIAGRTTASIRTSNTYRYRLNFLMRYLGDIDVQLITADMLDWVRQTALKDGLSPCTIENTIKHCLQVFARCGASVDRGTPLRIPPPEPQCMRLATLDAAMPHMPDWLRAFCSLAYVTGLRRDDLRKIRPDTLGDVLQFRASKTQKVHRFPIPPWCRRQLTGIPEFPRDTHTIYRNIRWACNDSKSAYFTPQQLRILSAQTWERLRPGLGPLLLGNTLPGWSQATKHYLDPWAGLFDHIGEFAAPPSLLTVEERCAERARQERLQRTIARLTGSKLDTLIQVAEGLAG